MRVWHAHRFAGMRRLLDAFAETCVQPAKIERFLESEPSRGAGTVRDQIAADMANQLLDALGQQGGQTGAEVKRLRERGAWKGLDQRPEA